MLEKVDHIAIAVENLDDSIRMYETMFGVEVADRERVEEFDVEIATFHIGGSEIELLEGKSEASAIRQFVTKRGPGLHHIAFAVTNIQAALDRLRENGAELIDETPRRGKQGSLVAFVHPRSTQRVLYELVQPANKDA